jgi:ABC-type nitrate/sulfonate/bicarbonate transport system permease component
MKALYLITPFRKVNNPIIIGIIWTLFVLGYFTFSNSTLLPNPLEIIQAAIKLFKADLIEHIYASLFLCFRAMFWAILISYGLSVFSTIPLFQPVALFFTQARFLTTVGLTFIFAQITNTTSEQKTVLLVFSITVFLLTGFLSIIADIKKSEFDYAKSLKMNNWQILWELVILGKSDLFIDSIRQNFAIAWMMLPLVETFCRAEGGIGILLTDQNKYFHLDAIYAIQIIVLFIGIGLDLFLKFILGIIRPDTLIHKK